MERKRYGFRSPKTQTLWKKLRDLEVGDTAKVLLLQGTEKTPPEMMTRNYINYIAKVAETRYSMSLSHDGYLTVTRKK